MTSDSEPFVSLIFSGSISPHGLKTEPVIARQFEQWQLYASTNSSATSNSTARHPHRPFSTRATMPPNLAVRQTCRSHVQRRPVGELLGVAVERSRVDQLEVEVACVAEDRRASGLAGGHGEDRHLDAVDEARRWSSSSGPCFPQ